MENDVKIIVKSIKIHQVKRGVPEFIKEKHHHFYGDLWLGKSTSLDLRMIFWILTMGNPLLGESKERGIPSNKP